jgi:uncharacterized protein YciI
MQFLVIAYDAEDDDAINRRMSVRDAHLATIRRYQDAGHMHMGAAILDDEGKMVGSTIICEFENEAGLNAWLAEDPYATNNVWGDVLITECKIGPSFVNKAS